MYERKETQIVVEHFNVVKLFQFIFWSIVGLLYLPIGFCVLLVTHLFNFVWSLIKWIFGQNVNPINLNFSFTWKSQKSITRTYRSW